MIADRVEIAGTNNAETIKALAGNDEVNPIEGNDTVYGGDGSGYVEGHVGNDTIYGGANSDNKAFSSNPSRKGLIGSDHSDTVYGQGGTDFIDLATFDTTGTIDKAYGGRGNDTIHAYDGEQDIINCGRGRGDHVNYDQALDTIKGCEKKHPNVFPPSYLESSSTERSATPYVLRSRGL